MMPDAGAAGLDVRFCAARERRPSNVGRRQRSQWEALKGALMCLPGLGRKMATEEIHESHGGLPPPWMAGDDYDELRSTVSPTLSSLPMSM